MVQVLRHLLHAQQSVICSGVCALDGLSDSSNEHGEAQNIGNSMQLACSIRPSILALHFVRICHCKDLPK